MRRALQFSLWTWSDIDPIHKENRDAGRSSRLRVTVIDLGDAVVLLPPGARQRLLADALTAEQHLKFVADLDDPDLATT